MNFGFSEDQELLRDTARKFLDSECPTTFVRKMMADETAHSTELWKKIAQLGWLGIIVPEEYGGSGGNFLDLVVMLGKEVPDEQHAIGNSGAFNHPHHRCDGYGRHPGDRSVEAGQVEMRARHARGVPAAHDELAGAAHEFAKARDGLRGAANDADAARRRELLGGRRTSCIPVQVQDFDRVPSGDQRIGEFGREIHLAWCGWVLHRYDQEAHWTAALRLLSRPHGAHSRCN